MNDRGAKALAERMDMLTEKQLGQSSATTTILGTTGLFISDVTKHEPDWEPDRDGDPLLCCSCGWDQTTGDGSFYDHVGTAT